MRGWYHYGASIILHARILFFVERVRVSPHWPSSELVNIRSFEDWEKMSISSIYTAYVMALRLIASVSKRLPSLVGRL